MVLVVSKTPAKLQHTGGSVAQEIRNTVKVGDHANYAEQAGIQRTCI